MLLDNLLETQRHRAVRGKICGIRLAIAVHLAVARSGIVVQDVDVVALHLPDDVFSYSHVLAVGVRRCKRHASAAVKVHPAL